MPTSSELRHWFNEYDPHAAQWLRGLMSRGLIPQGEVDERSIADLRPEDIVGDSCHFFAGIGGWSEALRLAGWPEDRPVWTGSCPCQPFSRAGKQKGAGDDRDLWPHFYRLIRELSPHVVFGEQVEAAVQFGWLDRVCTDLDSAGYTVGHCVLGAHSVGAPHQRQRLYWVASRGLGNSDLHERNGAKRRTDSQARDGRDDTQGEDGRGTVQPERASSPRRVGDTNSNGREPGRSTTPPNRHGDSTHAASGTHRCGFWDRFEFVNCADGKARRIKPGILTVVDGVPFRLADGRTVETANRTAILKGIGNAIVPQVAAEFIRAFLEVEQGE